MKTNVLVDNILAEQTELDTQMLAIKAMGGDEPYSCAYKAHKGLRRAIAKRILNTKGKMAKQFESIRSMRTMLPTLVGEIYDNSHNRRSILRPRSGTAVIYYNINNNERYKSLSFSPNSPFLLGRNPRSLLRPEINRDNTPGARASVPTPSYYPTPPATPIRGRCVWPLPQVQPDYVCSTLLGPLLLLMSVEPARPSLTSMTTALNSAPFSPPFRHPHRASLVPPAPQPMQGTSMTNLPLNHEN